jgi:opacity protein-like surface antigen
MAVRLEIASRTAVFMGKRISKVSRLAVIASMLAALSDINATAQDSSKPATPSDSKETTTVSQSAPVQFSAGVLEVLKLARSKVADDVIVSFINKSGVTYNLGASEIIYLRGQGVSERVISAMLKQHGKTPVPKAPAVPAQPSTIYGVPAPAYAQPPPVYILPAPAYTRTARTEIYGIGQYLHSDDITFNGPAGDVKVKMDDTGLGGFGLAFHFNEFLAVHADFMFGDSTFSGNLPTETGGTVHVSQDAFIQTGRFNVDYNIIKGRLSPFVTGGIGYQYLETELRNLPPIHVWDPWWGWQTYHPHAWETDFTWNVGAGIRWSVTDRIFIKATGGAQWLEYSGARGITTQIEGIFAIGCIF